MGDIQESKRKLQTKNSSTTGYRRKHIYLTDEIADTFADHYANIQKDFHKKKKPGKTEIRRTTIQQTIYRQKTKSSHKPTKEYSTRRGYCSSPYDKKLTPETLKYLLDMYNKIWKREKYQKFGETRYYNSLAEGEKRPKRCYELQTSSPNKYTLKNV